MTARSRESRKPGITAVAVAAAAILATPTTAIPIANAAPGGPQPTWSDGQSGRDLSELLLSAPQIVSITGAGGEMKVDGPFRNLDDQAAALSDTQCVSAWAPAQQQAYTGRGVTAAALDAVSDATNTSAPGRSVTQAVVAFPSAPSAADYLRSVARNWSSCANRTVTYTSRGVGHDWRFGTPAMSRDKSLLVIRQTSLETPSWQCERATGQRFSIVIDVIACAANSDNQAIAVVRGIAENIGVPA